MRTSTNLRNRDEFFSKRIQQLERHDDVNKTQKIFAKMVANYALELAEELDLPSRKLKHVISVRVIDVEFNVAGRLPFLLREIVVSPTRSQKAIVDHANMDIAVWDDAEVKKSGESARLRGSANIRNLHIQLTSQMREILSEKLSEFGTSLHIELLNKCESLAEFHAKLKRMSVTPDEYSLSYSDVVFDDKVAFQLSQSVAIINGVRFPITNNLVKSTRYPTLRVSYEKLIAALEHGHKGRQRVIKKRWAQPVRNSEPVSEVGSAGERTGQLPSFSEVASSTK
jgi:hypothetical protein